MHSVLEVQSSICFSLFNYATFVSLADFLNIHISYLSFILKISARK